MISIAVEVSGDQAKRLLVASREIVKEVDRALLAGAILLEGEIKKKISRGGRFNAKGVKTSRSNPGEPPKSDTGRLVGSITHTHSFLEANVGSNVFYAGFLERGTSKMAERPYLQPTLDENQDKILRWIEDALRKAIT